MISRFITLQSGQQINTIHILVNISRIERNQTMKFGQLIEYNMCNTFLEKSYTKCGGEASLSPLWRIKIEHISGTTVWNVIKGLKKAKKMSGTSLIFCIIFEEKYFSCYILLTDQILLPDCLYFFRYWRICVLFLFVVQSVPKWILKLTLTFLSSRFST